MVYYCILYIILSSYEFYQLLATSIPKKLNIGSFQKPHHANWIAWKAEYNKIYAQYVELLRFRVWLANLHEIKDHNIRFAQGREFYMKGLNKFSDLTVQELIRLLGSEVALASYYKKTDAIKLPIRDTPDSIDWSLHGSSSMSNFHALHANGWAFSAAEAVQAQIYKLTEAPNGRDRTFPGDYPKLTYIEDWILWKKDYNKHYTPGEEKVKIATWVSNYYQIKVHNQRFERGKELYKQSTNRFADLAPEELKENWLSEIYLSSFYTEMDSVTLPSQDVPESFDWILPGWVSVVREFRTLDWVFSATEAVQAQMYNVTGVNKMLSAKEIVDCLRPHHRHILTTKDTFGYIQNRGVTFESLYPLIFPKRRPCKRHEKDPKTFVRGFHLLEPENEENLKMAVAHIGPISVYIRATQRFFFYDSGVFYDPECKYGEKLTNHAVLLVGYGTDPMGGNFWVIKNNWGTDWGEYGFGRISRNSVADCGVADAALYPII